MSGLYRTAPLGGVRQPEFLNAVVLAESPLPPAALLRTVKAMERAAGRGVGRHWGPRPLDIDILDFGGRVIGSACGPRRRGGLVLPHPEMARRAFVLVPLRDVAPFWWHARLRCALPQLLARLPAQARRGIRRVASSRWAET